MREPWPPGRPAAVPRLEIPAHPTGRARARGLNLPLCPFPPTPNPWARRAVGKRWARGHWFL